MTWSTAAIPAAEQAALALDYPLFLASNIIDPGVPGARVRFNQDGDFIAADDSDPDYPAANAVDRSGLRLAKSSTAENTWYLVLNAPGIPGTGSVWDTIYLGSHNLDGAGVVGGVAVVVERASLATFASPTTVLTFGTINPERHLELLDERISGTGVVRLTITSGSLFTPSIGECWIGRRRQLRCTAKIGSDFDRVVSKGDRDGRISRDGVTEYVDRGDTEVTFGLLDNDSTMLDSETIAAWWSETRGGQWPSVFVPRPLSAPHRARIVRAGAPALSVPRDDFGSKSATIAMREQPPFLGMRP